MKLTVYLDMLLAVNFLINYILLKISSLIGQIPHSAARVIVSSAIGSVFSVSVFFDLGVVSSFVMKTASVLVCSAIAFGFISVKIFCRNTVCLLFSTFIFTGLIYAIPPDNNVVYLNNMFYYINLNPILLVGCIAAVYILLQAGEFLYSCKAGKEKLPCELIIDGKEIHLTAFYDTGFGVKDILGHRAVMLCSLPAVSDSLDGSLSSALYEFISGNINVSDRFHCVFYSDISKQGILPAIKPQQVKIKGKNINNVIIAFTDKTFSDDVQIIFGKDIFDITGD